MPKPPPKLESIKRLERYHKQKAREALEREQQEQKRLERNRRLRESRHAKAAAKAMSSQNLSAPPTPVHLVMRMFDDPDLRKDQGIKDLVGSAIKADAELGIERERTNQQRARTEQQRARTEQQRARTEQQRFETDTVVAHGRNIEALGRNMERAGENLDRSQRFVRGSGNRQDSEETIRSIFQMGRQLNFDDYQASVKTMDATDDIKIKTEQVVAVRHKSSDDQDDDESHFKAEKSSSEIKKVPASAFSSASVVVSMSGQKSSSDLKKVPASASAFESVAVSSEQLKAMVESHMEFSVDDLKSILVEQAEYNPDSLDVYNKSGLVKAIASFHAIRCTDSSRLVETFGQYGFKEQAEACLRQPSRGSLQALTYWALHIHHSEGRRSYDDADFLDVLLGFDITGMLQGCLKIDDRFGTKGTVSSPASNVMSQAAAAAAAAVAAPAAFPSTWLPAATTPKERPLAELFAGRNVAKWKCPQCFISVSLDNKDCICCGASNPNDPTSTFAAAIAPSSNALTASSFGATGSSVAPALIDTIAATGGSAGISFMASKDGNTFSSSVGAAGRATAGVSLMAQKDGCTFFSSVDTPSSCSFSFGAPVEGAKGCGPFSFATTKNCTAAVGSDFGGLDDDGIMNNDQDTYLTPKTPPTAKKWSPSGSMNANVNIDTEELFEGKTSRELSELLLATSMKLQKCGTTQPVSDEKRRLQAKQEALIAAIQKLATGTTRHQHPRQQMMMTSTAPTTMVCPISTCVLPTRVPGFVQKTTKYDILVESYMYEYLDDLHKKHKPHEVQGEEVVLEICGLWEICAVFKAMMMVHKEKDPMKLLDEKAMKEMCDRYKNSRLLKRMISFYLQHKPEKVLEHEMMFRTCDKYEGGKDSESQLFRTLAGKYQLDEGAVVREYLLAPSCPHPKVDNGGAAAPAGGVAPRVAPPYPSIDLVEHDATATPPVKKAKVETTTTTTTTRRTTRSSAHKMAKREIDETPATPRTTLKVVKADGMKIEETTAPTPVRRSTRKPPRSARKSTRSTAESK